eukprot:3045401-Rhodomonas_salina.1
MYLLNVEETVARGVYYAPKPFWEDITFNQLCEENCMAVLKCNRFFHCKWNSQDRSAGKKLEQTQTQVSVYINGASEADFHTPVDAKGAAVAEVWSSIRSELDVRHPAPKRFLRVDCQGRCETEFTVEVLSDGDLPPLGSEDLASTVALSRMSVFFMTRIDAGTVIRAEASGIDAASSSKESLAQLLSAWIVATSSMAVFTWPCSDGLSEESEDSDSDDRRDILSVLLSSPQPAETLPLT